MKSLFDNEEIELAIELNNNGIFWMPKSGDWFVDTSSVRALYDGSFEQSLALCLILSQDGRSFSYLELMIDGEENGNRMKKSMSLSDQEKLNQMMFIPSIKDCIDLIESGTYYIFEKLEKVNNYEFIATIKESESPERISCKGGTELKALYKILLNSYF